MSTELEISISKGRITNNLRLPNGKYKLYLTDEELCDTLVLVRASKLKLSNSFMKHKPKNKQEKEFKKNLSEVIKKGVKDFYRPICDPSFNEDGTGIHIKFGERSARGKSYSWWKKATRQFRPDCRLGTKDEYIAFLGVLIKEMVDNGWNVNDAWYAVCSDTEKIGSFKFPGAYKDTGTCEVCGFYDLANTVKILDDAENKGFWHVGGFYSMMTPQTYPISHLFHQCDPDVEHWSTVGWLVIET